jgi:hypothetical protein
MVNRCGEQNLAYVMLVQLKGLYGALFLFRVELTLFFQFFLSQLLLSHCCIPA